MQINKTETFLITHIKQNFEISFQKQEQINQKLFITSVVDKILKFNWKFIRIMPFCSLKLNEN